MLTRRAKIACASVALAVAVLLTGVAGWASIEYASGRDPFAWVSPAMATTTEAATDDQAPADAAARRKEGPTVSLAGEGDDAAASDAPDDADDGQPVVSQGRPSGTTDGQAGEQPPDPGAALGQRQEQPVSPGGGQDEAPVADHIEVSVSVDASSAGGGAYGGPVVLSAGATAYDALLAIGANVNARPTGFGIYVAAIDGVAEKDHGAMSGWVYAVNGSEPNTAASNYALFDGDAVVWTYVNVEY